MHCDNCVILHMFVEEKAVQGLYFMFVKVDTKLICLCLSRRVIHIYNGKSVTKVYYDSQRFINVRAQVAVNDL